MTLGRLLTMAHARQRANWAHTAAMLAELMNGPRQRRDQRAWQSRDLDPFAAPQPVAKVSPQEFIQALRSAWM